MIDFLTAGVRKLEASKQIRKVIPTFPDKIFPKVTQKEFSGIRFPAYFVQLPGHENGGVVPRGQLDHPFKKRLAQYL
jgi:hypothetical protein